MCIRDRPSGDSGGRPPAPDSSTWAFSAEQHTPRAHQQAPSRASALLASALQCMHGALATPQNSMPQLDKLMDTQQPHGTNLCSTVPDRLTDTQKLLQAVQEARRSAQAQKEALLHAEMKACSPSEPVHSGYFIQGILGNHDFWSHALTKLMCMQAHLHCTDKPDQHKRRSAWSSLLPRRRQAATSALHSCSNRTPPTFTSLQLSLIHISEPTRPY